MQKIFSIFRPFHYRRKGIKCRVILAVENADLLRLELIPKYLPSLQEGDVEVCEDLDALMARHGLNKAYTSCSLRTCDCNAIAKVKTTCQALENYTN